MYDYFTVINAAFLKKKHFFNTALNIILLILCFPLQITGCGHHVNVQNVIGNCQRGVGGFEQQLDGVVILGW